MNCRLNLWRTTKAYGITHWHWFSVRVSQKFYPELSGKIHHSIILYIFVGDLSPTKMRHFGSSWRADFPASTESFGPKNAISMAIQNCVRYQKNQVSIPTILIIQRDSPAGFSTTKPGSPKSHPITSIPWTHTLPLLLSLRWCLIGSDGKSMEGHDRCLEWFTVYIFEETNPISWVWGEICGPQKMHLATCLFNCCVIFTLSIWARGAPSCCMGMSRYTARSR